MKTFLSTLMLMMAWANVAWACDAAKASAINQTTAEAKTVSTCPMAKAATAEGQAKPCDPAACVKAQQNHDARAAQHGFGIQLVSSDRYIQAEGKTCSGLCAQSGGLLMFLVSIVLISGVMNFVSKR